MKEIEYKKYKRVLIFTAHPDDLEGFAGGLISLLANNAKVYSVIFSEGDRGRWEKKFREINKIDFEDLRVSEAQEAKAILKFNYVETLGFDDRKINENKLNVYTVLEHIKLIKPDLVLSFEFNKVFNFYSHPDHIAVGKCVRDAVKIYKNCDYFTFTTLRPNYYIDIEEVRGTKMSALACHKTQRKLNKIIFPFLEFLPDKTVGFLTGSKFAEGYRRVTI